MISPECIASYRGAELSRGDTFLYIPPHALLRPYLSNYTITFPTAQTMPDAYTILPTASSTMTIAVGASGIMSGLRGVDTKALQVGSFSNKLRLLLLIEFNPGGAHPFVPMDQLEWVDSSFALSDLDRALKQAIETELMECDSIEALVQALDSLFLTRLMRRHTDTGVSAMLHHIARHHGSTSARELSGAFHYSEKHIRRLFLRHVGVSPKTYARIVRVNHALRFLQDHPRSIADAAARAGFFDQPHMIHDLQTICGFTPQAFLQNMSVFYNDRFKL